MVQKEILGAPEEKIGVDFSIFLPSSVLTNEEIQSWKVATPSGSLLTADSILQRTGVERRYVADETTTPLSMGIAAATQVLNGRTDIDSVIVSSSFPTGANLADEIRKNLGLSADRVVEIGAACSGGVLGLLLAKEGEKTLLVATEKYSCFLEDLRRGVEHDPALSQTIFSDGAIALCFEKGKDFKVLSSLNKHFPEYAELICMPIQEELIRHPYVGVPVPSAPSGKFEQKGRDVYIAVRNLVPDLIKESIDKAGLKQGDIKYVFPHQGSLHMVEALSRRLAELRFVLDIREGNFSSVSSLIAFAKGLEGRQMEVFVGGKIQEEYITLKKEDKVILAGFGAGLFASIAVLELK
jgi:3-oxoacyl-[acyl-carrier-protein] synthase-3